tara:strand:- start:183 stop:881 length:699 start_codon:yes stop_codon:yes gene_type:complete
MKKIFQKFHNWIFSYNDESMNLIRFLDKIDNKRDLNILDVGCGYGRVLKLLEKEGFSAVGVEINEDIVKANQQSGLKCLSVNAFKVDNTMYDVVIMFHIIEHFSPQDLLSFMDYYLDKLKPGGHLIIATPVLTSYFYDDFDHVKPYSPVGIEMVFGTSNSQVQYYSNNKLELLDLWYKRYYYRLVHQRGLHIKVGSKYIILGLHLLSVVLFKLSGGRIGKVDGWMGLYQKDL